MRPRFAGLWRHHDFLKLWSGQTVSVFGSLITRTALPFTAILVLNATPFQVAILSAADIVAGLLVGLVAGVWVDRLRRRPLLIGTDVARAVLLATVPIAAVLDVLRIEQLYLVAFLTGTLTIIFDVAYQSYLPSLVQREDLLEGNSKLSASASVAEVGAFGLAGWLVQIFTAPIAILIDAGTFVVSALSLLLIRAPEPPPAAVEHRQSLRSELTAGLREVFGSPVLRALAGCALTQALAGGMVGTVILLYTNRELGFSPGVLGMIFAVGGVTSLLGAVAAGRVTRRGGIGPTMIIAAAISAVGLLFVPAARDASLVGAALLIASQCVTDPAHTVFSIAEVSLRQSVTRPGFLGRVNAGIRFSSLLMMLGGTLLAGALGETVGLRPTLLLAAGLNVLSVLWLVCSPVRGMVEAPLPDDEG